VRIDLGSCRVRDIEPADAEPMSRHGNNRKIWLQLRDRFPHPYSRQDAEAFVSGVMAQTPRTIWAIEVDGEAVGTIGLVLGSDVERISAEIGYWLGESYWGRGIMTDVVRALTLEGVKQFHLKRVFAVPFATNAPSCRVLENAGFVCEGRLRKSAIKDGQVLDQLLYAYVGPDNEPHGE
jgi:RimJ/RimL family protein N-acetyltransferase